MCNLPSFFLPVSFLLIVCQHSGTVRHNRLIWGLRERDNPYLPAVDMVIVSAQSATASVKVVFPTLCVPVKAIFMIDWIFITGRVGDVANNPLFSEFLR